ncbi:MAG: flagellar biosynthesis protein FlhB [Phycisphaerales bacterium]
MAEDLGEKTEQPTEKRRKESREKGQVAKSTDFGSAFLLTGVVVLMALFGDNVLLSITNAMGMMLDETTLARDLTGSTTAREAARAFGESTRWLLPVWGMLIAVAIAGGLMQVGFLLAPKALQPKLERINPIKGIGRLFSKRSVVKATLDVLKFAVIFSVGALVVQTKYDELIGLAFLPLTPSVVMTARIVLELAVWVLVVLLVLGIIDFTYQKWQNTEDMKMTRHEVKDERKSSEGDPDVKNRRMRMARQIAMQRLAQDVPRADVIVTNPTHYSVALRYDAEHDDAPRVVAKGADFLALRIRQLAVTNGVPIIERPPLARALYHQVPVGGLIDPEFYEAVAELLAYVYRLEGKAQSMGESLEHALT